MGRSNEASRADGRRSPWRAALLGLVAGGIAQVYCGRLLRALVVEVLFWLIGVVALVLLLYLPFGRWGLAAALALLPLGRALVIADAVRLARNQPRGLLRFYQDGWTYALGFVALAALEATLAWEIGRVWVWPLRERSAGMADTVLPGDCLLIDRLWYGFQPVAHGDVVAFNAGWPGRPLWVRRVVGLPGDEIAIRDERVYRNGRPLEEAYVKGQGYKEPELANFGPVTVPPGNLFLLGDNRRACNDSRILGFVSIHDVLGRVQLVCWSNTFRHGGWDAAGEQPGWLGPVRWQRLGLRLERQ